ncbi:D-2-hydroxyacid dehydrogenase family protein [Micrococcales bacterium 31B]|nr:D-2-hydroxyacid dehydrogenase family protein [Micrococcales bacterium 31B]
MSGTFSCAVLDDYQGAARTSADWSRLENVATVDFFASPFSGEHDLVDKLRRYDCLIVMRERTPVTAQVLAQLPQLRLVVTSGMRNNAIDLVAAAQRGVTVCGTASYSEPPLELTWALLLAACRHLPREVASLRAGGPWQQTVGNDLFGRTLGLVGLGKIGTRMVPVATAFGMRVVAWSPHLTKDRADAAGAEFAGSLSSLLHASDIVSLHLALAPSTRQVLGAREFAQMKPGALLVNTARAGLVDTPALVSALREGTLGGAALDVFDTEPLAASDQLRSLPNVVATPHLGYVTQRNYETYFGEAIDDVLAFVAGTPVRELTTSPPSV